MDPVFQRGDGVTKGHVKRIYHLAFSLGGTCDVPPGLRGQTLCSLFQRFERVISLTHFA
jgi:hypothetical protein